MKSMPGQKKPEAYFEMELFPSLKPVFQLLGLTFEESLEVSQDQRTTTFYIDHVLPHHGLVQSIISDRWARSMLCRCSARLSRWTGGIRAR